MIRKTRGLFKKIGDIKGICHARISTIKDRNSKNLTEADILRGSKNTTQKNSRRKVLMTQITRMMWSLT